MWKDAYLEGRVMAADPLELVTILYEYGIQAIEDARAHLAAGDIELRLRAVSKAISIIGELHGSLDHAAGGEIATRLASLYAYMEYRLTTGNLQQKDEPFAEVESLMRTLAEAWTGIHCPNQPGKSFAGAQSATNTAGMPFALGGSQASGVSWSA